MNFLARYGFLAVLALASFSLSGCGGDSAEEVVLIESPYTQESVNGQRAVGLAGIYQAVAAAPTYEEIVMAAERLSGPLPGAPTSCQEQAGWLENFAALIGQYVRHPELIDHMLEVRDQLVGVLDFSAAPLCDEALASRMRALGAVYEAIGRDPSMAEALINFTLENAGPPGDPASFSPAIQAARLLSFGKLYEAIGRNPANEDLLLDAADRLAGARVYYYPIENPEVQAARMEAMGAVFEGIARVPHLADHLILTALELGGPTGDPFTFGPKVQAARLKSFAKLYEGIARQPELEGELLAAADLLAGQITYANPIDDPMLQAARMASMGMIFESMARQPELAERLMVIALQMAGAPGNPANFEPLVQASRLESLGQLYEGIARQPVAQELLLSSVTPLLGNVEYTTPILDETVQAARVASLGDLFRSIARQPEMNDTLLTVALQLSGPSSEAALAPDTVQAARMTALGGFYEGIVRNPGAHDLLVEATEGLLGPIPQGVSEDLPFQVQQARMASLRSLYEGFASLPPEMWEPTLLAVESLAGKPSGSEAAEDL